MSHSFGGLYHFSVLPMSQCNANATIFCVSEVTQECRFQNKTLPTLAMNDFFFARSYFNRIHLKWPELEFFFQSFVALYCLMERKIFLKYMYVLWFSTQFLSTLFDIFSKILFLTAFFPKKNLFDRLVFGNYTLLLTYQLRRSGKFSRKLWK